MKTWIDYAGDFLKRFHPLLVVVTALAIMVSIFAIATRPDTVEAPPSPSCAGTSSARPASPGRTATP
jgi:hypothetical protein